MSYVDRIIDCLGGVRPAATALRLPPSTVQAWKTRGTIPPKHDLPILSAAARRGIVLTYEDLARSRAEALAPAGSGEAA